MTAIRLPRDVQELQQLQVPRRSKLLHFHKPTRRLAVDAIPELRCQLPACKHFLFQGASEKFPCSEIIFLKSRSSWSVKGFASLMPKAGTHTAPSSASAGLPAAKAVSAVPKNCSCSRRQTLGAPSAALVVACHLNATKKTSSHHRRAPRAAAPPNQASV